MNTYHVAILTHVPTMIAIEDTITNKLTQFFVDVNAMLHTSILVETLCSKLDIVKLETTSGKTQKVTQPTQRLVLVNTEKHLKECVASTAQFQDQKADVVIALCHGFGMTDHVPSAGLCFRCESRGLGTQETSVYAKPFDEIPNCVTLHSVIKYCKLAILLCCSGKDVLTSYFQHISESRSGTYPEILFCDTEFIYSSTIEIYMVLLINILDSELTDVEFTHHDTRKAIVRIMQIVKLFGDDHIGFWLYLQQVGCITSTQDEKDRQQLAYPHRQILDHSIGVYGCVCNFPIGTFPRTLFEEFKAIKLIKFTFTGQTLNGEYTTCSNVPDIQLTNDQNQSRVDKFLRQYQQLKRPTQTHKASHDSSTGSPTSLVSSPDSFPSSPSAFDPPEFDTPDSINTDSFVTHALAQLKQLLLHS